MKVEIISKKENPLLRRTEVKFRVGFTNKISRAELREEICKLVNTKKENVVVESTRTRFGKPEATGYARAYTSVKSLRETEPKHILRRNKIIKEKPPKEKPKKEEKPVEKKEKKEKVEKEKPEETKEEVEEKIEEEIPKKEKEGVKGEKPGKPVEKKGKKSRGKEKSGGIGKEKSMEEKPKKSK